MFYSRLKLILLIGIFCNCWPLAHSALPPLTNANDLSVVDAGILEFAVSQIFAAITEEPRSSFAINLYGLNSAAEQRLANLVNMVLRRTSDIPVHIGEGHWKQAYLHFYMQLIFVDDVSSLRNLSQAAKADDNQLHFTRHLIVLSPELLPDVPPLQTMQKMFYFFHTRHMLNGNIAVAVSSGEVKVYTYFPYMPNDCDSMQPQLLHTHRAGATIPPPQTLYPMKFENMNGCPLHVVTAHVPPFVVLEPFKTGLEALSGMEGLMLKEIARKMNFTVELWNTGENVGGIVMRNGSVFGIYKILLEKRADLAIGDCGCYPLRMQLLASTNSFYQSYMHIIAKRGPFHSSFEVLFYPFKHDIRLITIAIVALRCGVKLFGACSRLCPRQFRRFMFAMWLLIFFFYRCGYESFCFSYLREPPLRPQPNTVREFQQNGYIIMADRISASFLQWNAGLRQFVWQLPIGPKDTFYILMNYSGHKRGALAKPEHWAHQLQSVPEDRRQLYVAHENIVSEMLCIYFQRHSYLVAPFNEVLLRMQDSGLIFKFLKDFVDLNVFEHLRDTPRQRLAKQYPVTNLKALNVSQLEGAFLFTGLMLSIGLALFVFECLSMKWRSIKRVLDKLH